MYFVCLVTDANTCLKHIWKAEMQKMMDVIREYEPLDAFQVEQCIIELQDFERNLEPDLVAGITISKRYLQDMLDECQKKTGKIFVAETHGQVIGFVSVRREPDWDSYLSNITDHAYISDLVVLHTHRGQGIGKMLLQKAEEYAMQLGMMVVKIGVLSRNKRAFHLYEQSGFHSYQIILMKDLGIGSK